VVENVSPSYARPAKSGAAVNEHGFGKFAISTQNGRELLVGEGRDRVVARRDVANLKARRAIDAKQILIRIEAKVLLIE
jgi:hypothetical protein